MSSSVPPSVEGGYPEEFDARSEAGAMFENVAPNISASTAGPGPAANPPFQGGLPPAGRTRRAPPAAQVVGRGVIPPDPRKFRYDLTRARQMHQLSFGATRADRMDAAEAGALLDQIHVRFGIDRETEDVLSAFDKALFFEHTVNGASMLQSARGVITVGDSVFDIATVKTILGVAQRRFFRAFADEIADVNREILAGYDPYDPTTVEKYGQITQVAVERGLQKYPHLAHDSSDAGVTLSLEERVALMASKRVVLESVVNNVDTVQPRVNGARAGAPSRE